MERTSGETDKLIRDGWDLYRRVERIRRSVDLHAAGLDFGRMEVVLSDGNAFQSIPVEPAPGLLRQVGVNLYVAGSASVAERVFEQSVALSSGDDCKFYFRQSSSPSAPLGALWTVAKNHDAILSSYANSSMAEIVSSGNLWSFTLPQSLLSTQASLALSADQIANMLNFEYLYVSTVNDLKQAVGGSLSRFLKAQWPKGRWFVVQVSWQPTWLGVSGLGGQYELGYVYQTFKREGIDLVNLKKGAIDGLNQLQEVGIIPRSQAAKVAASFGL